MKTLLVACCYLVGASFDLHAQGTIAFQNFNQVSGRVWFNPNWWFGTNGGIMGPAGYHVELLFAPIGGTNFSSARILNNSTISGGEFFDGSTVFLSGITAGTGNGDTNSVQLYLRGWTGPYGDWNSALVSSDSAVGQTAIFLNPTGGTGTASPANLVGWLANNPLVIPAPEPSTISVTGLGALLWLGYRRWKPREGAVRINTLGASL